MWGSILGAWAQQARSQFDRIPEGVRVVVRVRVRVRFEVRVTVTVTVTVRCHM